MKVLQLNPQQAAAVEEYRREAHGVGSLVETGGRKRSVVVEKVTAQNLRAVVTANVKEGSAVHTDEFRSYKNLKDKSQRETVNHAEGQYVRKFKCGKTITTNPVESSFALLKRGIYGTFHHVSKGHLHRYYTEFDFRWNSRTTTDGERTETSLKATEGKRLRYRDPVAESL